jgi:hypothetical protein
MPDRSENTLSAEQQSNVRAAAVEAGVKGLFLMNGGGAVALLAFLQAIWQDAPADLVRRVLTGLAFMGAGVALAAPVNFLRYHTSIAFQSRHLVAYKWLRRGMLTCQYLSILAFVAACGVVILGAWQVVPGRAG